MIAMKIRIKDGYVLVKLDKKKEKTNSGIVIPDQAKKPSTTAQVIIIGKDVEEITPGDKVVLQPYAGKEIKIDKDQYLIVDVRYILGIIED